MPGSYLDTPAVALPSGVQRIPGLDGRPAFLPTGLQLMRPRGDDDRLLRIALSVEQVLSPSTVPIDRSA